MLKRSLALVLILFSAALPLPAQDTDLSSVFYSWELRGSLAVARMNSMLNELNALQGSEGKQRDINRIAGEIAIESAYALHKNLPEAARKKVDTGLVCHLVLNAGEKGLFDMAYQYDNSGTLVSAYVDRLPEGWRVRLPEDDFPTILVRTYKNQVFAFHTKEPFKAVYWGE